MKTELLLQLSNSYNLFSFIMARPSSLFVATSED